MTTTTEAEVSDEVAIEEGPSEAECAGLALQFLPRVQLSGQEVPAFNYVSQWLSRTANPNK